MLEFRIPKSAEVREVADILACHQAAIDFKQEAEHRQAFEDYCQWYYRLAEQNQAELEAMRRQDARNPFSQLFS